MRKLLISTFIGFVAIAGFSISTAHAASFSYYRSITVTSTVSIASGTNVNFPMLVSSTYSDWASSAHSGSIQNLVTAPNGGQEAADLVFATSTANCTAGIYMNFETETYNSSTGAIVDWVNVPSMSAGSVIYACYDATAVTTDQSHPSSTWNNNYVLVAHLPTPTSTLTAFDSTSNANNGTITAATTTVGAIDGGASFNGSSAYVNFNATS